MSNRAAVRLREELTHRCFEAGIGFRMVVDTTESGRTTFSIKVDRQRPGDEVMELDGVKVFLGPSSAAQLSNYRLDYQDEPNSGFFMRTMQEARGG
jgi:Fe-S cluster assembly iron-binding protein IscA